MSQNLSQETFRKEFDDVFLEGDRGDVPFMEMIAGLLINGGRRLEPGHVFKETILKYSTQILK